MSKNNTNKKPYSAMKFFKDGIIVELILLYITLVIGDAISIAGDDRNMFLTRYLPVAVVTLISTFLIIKCNSKKCTKTEEEVVRRNIFIIPIIVAVILLFYGLYSVKSNIDEMKESNFYSMIYGEEIMEDLLEDVAKEARMSWVITSVTYLVVAEVVAVMTSKKIKHWVKADEIQVADFDGGTQNPIGENTNVGPMQQENVSNSNIKWDL